MKNNLLVSSLFMISMSLNTFADTGERLYAEVMTDYLKIQETLASDSMDGVRASAVKIADLLKKHKQTPVDWSAVSSGSKKMIDSSNDLKKARESFKELSLPIVRLTQKYADKKYRKLNCSMAKGSWVQRAGASQNPYFGKSMLGCGTPIASK